MDVPAEPSLGITAGGDHLSYFALLGRIAGMALYHSEHIPARWTQAFFCQGSLRVSIAVFDPKTALCALSMPLPFMMFAGHAKDIR